MGSVRTSLRRVVLALVLGSMAMGLCGIANAQDRPAHGDPKARAADLYKESVETYRKGEFQKTIDLLQEAFALDPQPVLLYNLARADEGIGNTDGAISTYQRYLAADPNTKDRGAIEQRIVTLQRERDERIALQKQSDADRKRAEEEAARAVAAAKQKKEALPPHHRSAFPYIVGGIGIAGLGTGAVLGLMATSQHATARDEPVQQTAESDQNKAHTLATVSTVAFIAGGALFALGTTWWILDSGNGSGASTKSARLGVTGNRLVLEGTFQ